VVLGNSRFLDKDILDFHNFNWYPFMNSLQWLLRGENELETPPPPTTSRVTLTAETSASLFWLVVVIMPGIALLIGMCIWWVRRS
jgi:ABC-type uncharacterized transport system involved in gliding motility auxiliary subunit